MNVSRLLAELTHEGGNIDFQIGGRHQTSKDLASAACAAIVVSDYVTKLLSDTCSRSVLKILVGALHDDSPR